MARYLPMRLDVTSDAKAAVAAAVRDLSTDSWAKRRRIMHWSLIFIGFSLAYMLLFAPSDGLHENLAIALVGAGTGIIGSYVFGAVWDDNNKRAMVTNVTAPPSEE